MDVMSEADVGYLTFQQAADLLRVHRTAIYPVA